MLSKTKRSIIFPLTIALTASVVLVGCGRKGAIDPPSTPVELRNKRASDGAEQKQTAPDRPFVLDKLL